MLTLERYWPRKTVSSHLKLTFLLKCAIQLSHCSIEVDLKQAKCKQPHKWYFALKITSFSDAFIAKTIRLHNTVVLHRSPPKDSNQENWSSTHFYWFKSSTWSRKSLSGEVWTPVQAPNMASNHGTIVEMSVFKGFKLWSLSELIVLFRHCRRVKQWEENIALFSQVREPLKKGSRPIHSLIHSRS